MFTRRQMMLASAAAAAGGAAMLQRIAGADDAPAANGSYTPVVTPNGSTLAWTMEDGFKTFRLVAEPVKREFAPGMTVNCWGYNGQTPGPTIEAVEGDRVRIYLTNHLPEPTSMHWHGVIIPNGMDGVAGLTQPHVQPGETYVYEFELKQNGTQMYHPHSDEMVQMAMGMQGFFIIHPKSRPEKIDRDFCIFLQEWFVDPGSFTPNPMVMTDFNLFTFNSKVYPGTAPLIIRRGDRVRIRLANLSMDNHPIHFHGHRAMIVGTDAGPIAPGAQWPAVTIDVPPGSTRDFEFVADNPGDWPLHCHKNHHAMNAMSHNIANMIGVDQGKSAEQIEKILPGYMPMGTEGMHDMSNMQMALPKNTLPMMSGQGPFGAIMMGGMFTILKIRDELKDYQTDPGWYQQPAGTAARRVDGPG